MLLLNDIHIKRPILKPYSNYISNLKMKFLKFPFFLLMVASATAYPTADFDSEITIQSNVLKTIPKLEPEAIVPETTIIKSDVVEHPLIPKGTKGTPVCDKIAFDNCTTKLLMLSDEAFVFPENMTLMDARCE